MAVIKKFADNLTQNLTTFGTFLIDENPNSQYFKITEFKDTFTGGKNGFLIEGSEHLKETTEIKIQILDVDGNPVYYEPGDGIPEYYEGTSKLVAVYVYEDTPIGTAKITILGELKTYVDDGGVVRDIPDEWKGVYNVKWEKSFQINRLLSNEDKVRFYRRPQVSITEIVKPIFNNVTTTIVQTGSLSGIAQFPREGEPLTQYSIPTSYLLEIQDSTNWTGSVVGTTISVPSLGYSTLADSVINSKDLLVVNPYTQNGLVANFSNEGYTASFNYVESANNLKTALTGSFAKISITDLKTFVGDVARVKIFRKSQSDVADYQFIQEIRLESNELLRDLDSQLKNEEFFGVFDSTNYKNYWVTSSNYLSADINQSFLYNSVKLNSVGTNSFFTSKSLDIKQGTEYTLTFNIRKEANSNVSDYLKVFLGDLNLIDTQNIITVTSDNSILQKSQITANFVANSIEDVRLYFEVVGSGWYISDVSLRASQETAYSPDEITFIQSVPRTLPEETFLYDFEFYDINNNYIPVTVQASKTFNGGNLQTLQKGLVFTPRSLQFQFDSGSNPVPPTVVGFTVTKNLLTGSVTYTSQSFDFDGNELFDYEYTASITDGGGYPGLLDGILTDNPTMTVQHFTGSRSDKTVQLIRITGEVEGYTDTVIFSRVLDGFGGVNYVIRPYRGTQIRNSSTASLEIQAVRIDGVNDIELSSTTKPEKGWPDTQLHIISRSIEGDEKFVNLSYASSSGYIIGLTTGSLGSGEIDYNATFNRDSIDTRRTIYMMSSASAASGPAYITSASVLTSIILEDLQDGLDTPVITYNTDTFNIDPRNENLFRPQFAFATASFYKRGTTELVTAEFQVFPSMSINNDWVPEYWLYYTTQSVDATISVSAIDEGKRVINAGGLLSYIGSPLSQSKNLTLTFTYTEPYTSASIAVDKTFTIVPQGNPGDETIVFEITPSTINLSANSRGEVGSYTQTVTEIKVKQGSRYLAFTGSVSNDKFSSHGTFHIASASIIGSNITPGLVYFDNNYTESLIVSASSNMTDLSGSVTYPLIIHPYFTSSIYTQSIVQQYNKVLDGPPPIEIVITPTAVTIPADEVGFVSSYTNANTSIIVKEGNDLLMYNTSSLPGTWKINNISAVNIRTGSLSTGSLLTPNANVTFNRFDYPFVSASALYTLQVYPYSLGEGHKHSSTIYQRTQTFTKNVSQPAARSVDFKASSYTINYDRDGVVTQPEGDITLTATAFNTTGSVWFRWYFIDTDGSEIPYGGPDPETTPLSKEASIQIGGGDAAGAGEVKTWKVKIWDGDSDGNSPIALGTKPVRAEAQLTITGVKGGSDAYKYSATNLNTSVTADLWTTQFTGSGIQISAFKGITPLQHTSSYTPSQEVYDYLGNFIGNLGYYSASIYSKSNTITLSPQNRLLGNPASIPDITNWVAPAVNSLAEVIYKIDYEKGRQVDYVTQSISVQFTPPAPYDVKMQNDLSGVTYRVSGEIELDNTQNVIRVFRGSEELTNVSSFSGAKLDAYGATGYPNQCRVSIYAKSSHITISGGLTAGSFVSGTPATMPGITAWLNPEANQVAQIVYQIDCEGRQTLYKTQSFSVTYEGNTGPGIVMRGIWNSGLDYIGSVQTTNQRRDAVIWPDPATINNETHYWAAVSGSGPSTPSGPQQPDGTAPYTDTAYWQYLGQEDFFVSAKIAIFEESFVKNTINVGVKDNGTSAFANIVIAGGRPDPYIAIGQTGTYGTAGTSGTSAVTPGVIGYNRPGIFLGIYEDGAAGTTGRFSIKTTGTSGKGMYWDGDTLTVVGAIRQREPGIPEGSFRGAWTAGTTYYPDDTVTYGGASYINSVTHLSTNDTNIGTGYPPNATNSWTVYAAAGTSGTAGSSGTAGINGEPGAGVVFRGNFSTDNVYYHTTDRRDIVRAGSTFYLVNNPSLNDQSGSVWGTPPNSNWSSFGAQFSSVATDILLAQDATITRGLVMGVEGSNTSFIRSADATSIVSGSGFFMDSAGRMRFGQQVQAGSNYIYWNGASLEVSGVLTATAGSIGGWNISSAGLEYTNADGNRRLKLNSERGSFEVFYSGSLLVDINSNTALTDLTSVASVWSNLVSQSMGTVPGDGTPVYGNISDTTAVLTAGKTYQFTWGTGFIPTINNTGEYISVYYGLILSTDSTPTVNNSAYTLAGGAYKSGPGNLQLESFTSVFTAGSTNTYYVRPFMTVYSSTSTYDPFIGEWTSTYENAYLNGDLYYYGATITPSIEKTEIVGGGIQVVKDTDTYFKVDRNASGDIINPFVYSQGASVKFKGAASGDENAFYVENFESISIGCPSGYISWSPTSTTSIYDTKAAGSTYGGMRISSNNYIRLEPNGPGGYFAYVGYSNNPDFQIKVANGANPSDERVKTEIETLEDGSIEKIKELNLRKFRYRDCETGYGTGHTKIGVIAQELQNTSLNGLVLDNTNGIQLSVDYDSLLGHALKAIQELSKKVEILEAQISGSIK